MDCFPNHTHEGNIMVIKPYRNELDRLDTMIEQITTPQIFKLNYYANYWFVSSTYSHNLKKTPHRH